MDALSHSGRSVRKPGDKTGIILLVLAMVLALVTQFCMQHLERFYVSETQLLVDPQYSAGGSHWDEKGRGVTSFLDNRVTIINSADVNHSVFQNIKVDALEYYRFSIKAGVEGVVPGSSEDWALASVYVIYRDETGNRIGSSSISRLKGSKQPLTYSKQLLMMKSVSSIDLAFRLLRAEGKFTVSEPVVSRLQEYLFFKILRILIIFAWLVFAAVTAWMVFRVLKVWQMLLYIVLVGIALVGTMMPGDLLSDLTVKIADLLPESLLVGMQAVLSGVYGESNFTDPGRGVSKLGHVLIFLCIGILAGLSWHRIGVIFAATCLAVFALVTEALQTFVFGRSTTFSDIVLDCVGGFSGLFIGLLIIFVIELVKSPAEKLK